MLAASCIRTPTPGMKVKSASDRAKTARKMVFELLIADQPDRDTQAHDPASKFWTWADRMEIADEPPAARASAIPRRTAAIRDGGQSRRLHPVQSLRPRLPRGAGQRRDRHGRPRPQREDRVRLRRPDGRLDLRRLRRMRAGLPDRRADAGDAGQRGQRAHRRAFPRPQGRQRVPVLRRRLPAHLQHQGRQAALRHRQGRPGEPEPAVREGPLRLRLRDQSAAPDPADDPQGRRRRSTPTIWSIRRIRGRISAPPPGKRRWSAPPPAS